jgi:pre-mRNA-splicing factor ATP-dependent RNA helicase DHX15/PRP43
MTSSSDNGTNPYTGRPYSKRYHDILKQRQRLPIFDARDKIQKLVQAYQVMLLIGETGSGKTTQVPQFVLDLKPERMIACTQPRRVAAMSVSERVSEEMDVALGAEVGYTIRFDDMSSDKTVIKYLTDGMLLREAMMDPQLSKYSVIIIDEAHERTVQTDILLGALKALLHRRPELRLIVMSATLEHEKFGQYFPTAPIVHVTGRMYGVEVYFAVEPEANYLEAAIRTAIQIHQYEGEGDILVFLTGEDEIETATERIAIAAQTPSSSAVGSNGAAPFLGPVSVLPLYSALPPASQKRVFREVPAGTRKIVIATNIAETSLTIDGIVFVVDAGFSKQKVFNPKLRLESLLVTPISQAAAEQRSGRAGRTKHGKCFRLYTKKAFKTQLQEQTHPEILRCNLGSVVLDMKKMGVDDLVHFDFIDPPAPQTLMRALELLNNLGALDDDGDLTPFGEQMSRFPLEPEMCAMLLRAQEFKCATECCKIAAMLSIQQPYIQQQDRRAQHCREQWQHQTGDHLTLLNLYQDFEANGFNPEWCKENFLNPRNMQQAASVNRQLLGIMKSQIGADMSTDPDQDPRFGNHIRRAVLSGFFANVAIATPTKNQYQSMKDGVRAIVYPTSVLKHRPQFVVYNELVMTSNTYVRTITSLSDDWIIDACPAYFDLEDFDDGLVKNALKNLHKTRELRLKKDAIKAARVQPIAGPGADSDSD